MRNWIFLLLYFNVFYADPIEDLKKNVCDVIPTLYGWCSKEKAVQFIDLVLQVKPDICVEIGVFGGRSIFPVASALKFIDQGIVIAIDPWDKEEIIRYFDPVKDKAHIDWWSKVNMEHVYYSYLGMLSQYQLEDYAITLRIPSQLACSVIDTIDILYIDGNHDEEASMNDVRMYLPKVRSGGYIWLNDSLWNAMQGSVDLLFEECDFIKLIDGGNCILFRKR